MAIIGKTNVGKSTLLNRLLHEDRAIVSSVHGTTRDTIEDTVNINGITFRFIDTAGIRQTTDEVEQIGIQRTYAAIEKARIVLWVVDAVPSEDDVRETLDRANGKSLIIIRNKIDIADLSVVDMRYENALKNLPTIAISAKQGTNIELLENVLFKAANIPELTEQDIIVTSARQYHSLVRAHENLSRVLEGLESDLSGDLISEDLRLVLDDLADITGQGRIVTNEVLSNIFSHFCVGK